MKLIRYGEINKEKTGVVINDVMYDTSLFGEDYNEKFFETDGLKKLQQFIESNKNKLQQIAGGTRIGSPVARPSKIVCIGLNYADHAKETGAVLPPDYCLHNDVSEREFQIERNGTWDKGKGCDTFAPLGPWLVTRDEITDVDNLNLWLTVNNHYMQNGTTANLIFRIPFLISYVSQFMTLLPGDVISTGTPAGVGLGMNPQVYLRAGDVVELGIDGLGTARQKVVAFS